MEKTTKQKTLELVGQWRLEGMTDQQIIEKLVDFYDTALSMMHNLFKEQIISTYRADRRVTPDEIADEYQKLNVEYGGN